VQQQLLSRGNPIALHGAAITSVAFLIAADTDLIFTKAALVTLVSLQDTSFLPALDLFWS